MRSLKIKGSLLSPAIMVLLACGDMGSDPPGNRPPAITSSGSVEAVVGIQFSYTATASDPDGTQPTITIENNPSWTDVTGSTIGGTPAFSTPDTSFMVVASDGELADTVVVAVAVAPNPTLISYSGEIQPIFDNNCAESGCHIPGPAYGLSLNNYAELMQGGLSGPVVIAGDPDTSIMVRRLEGDIIPQMPYQRPALSPSDIQKIRDWIEQGALDN
jgi:hypothetical protein